MPFVSHVVPHPFGLKLGGLCVNARTPRSVHKHAQAIALLRDLLAEVLLPLLLVDSWSYLMSMFLWMNSPFGSNNGVGNSFAIHIPTFHFLFSSSSLWYTSAQSPPRPLKLCSTIATNRVMIVSRAAGSSCVQPEPDNEDHFQKQQGSSSDDQLQAKQRPQKQRSPLSETSSVEGKPPSSTTCPSSSRDPSSSQGCGGYQSLTSSKAQASSATAGLLPLNPPPRFERLSYISKGIKAAFQGWQVFQKLHVPSPEGALLAGFGAGNWVLLSVKATKFLAKGLKVSQKVLTSGPFTELISKWCHPDGAIIEKAVQKDLSFLAKGFNAFYAAIKVVHFTKGLGWQPQELRLPDGISIWKGYKFSKNLLTILDAVVGKNGWNFTYMGEVFLVVKRSVGGIGVIVKAAFLSKELCVAVLKRLAISEGIFASALLTDYQRYYREMLVNRYHRRKPKRLLCMTMTNESNLSDLSLVSLPHGSVRNENLSSLIFLFQTFTDEFESLPVKFCEEDEVPMVFCLAIPLPTSEILVFV